MGHVFDEHAQAAHGSGRGRSSLPVQAESSAPYVGPLSVAAARHLQHAAGNSAVQRLILQRNCGRLSPQEHMEELAVDADEILYTGTDDDDFYQTLISFDGTREEFVAAFMTYNARQRQNAQMGGGIYATPNKQAALGYGKHLVKITPKAGCMLLNLDDRKIALALPKVGVKPNMRASINPDCIIRFNGGYHVIKTNKVKMEADQ